ncbi:MAG: FAD binding domain-containing protein [Alphaproteobacteria bacterium]
MEYGRPTDLDEALALLSQGSWTLLAGGTDLFPATTGPSLDCNILDIGAITDLRGIAEDDQSWRLGARTTWTELAEATLPPAFDALKLAAREIGSIQIQNTATLVGNICNASPAADGVPPLLILDAEIELRSARATRRLPLAEFTLGVRKTARAPDELVTAIILPKRATSGRSDFLKLGARRFLVISIAMVAARIVVTDNQIAEVALAVGSCSATAQRLPSVEHALLGQRANPEISEIVSQEQVAPLLSPIDDIRGSADYREHAATELLRRVVLGAAGLS